MIFRCDHHHYPVEACEYGCHDFNVAWLRPEDRASEDGPSLTLALGMLDFIANNDGQLDKWHADKNRETGQDGLDEVCEDLIDTFWPNEEKPEAKPQSPYFRPPIECVLCGKMIPNGGLYCPQCSAL